MARAQRSASAQVARGVAEGRVSSKQLYGLVALSTAILLLGILLYLWPQMRIVELGYQQDALRLQQVQALQRQKELQVELASLRRLDRIEQLAMQQLGMKPPQLSQVIYLRQRQETVSASARRMP
ncbi:MAG TPA: cell division protein FtsL [Candidatus Entotheonella sp.]|jgi:cell division protein FtsL